MKRTVFCAALLLAAGCSSPKKNRTVDPLRVETIVAAPSADVGAAVYVGAIEEESSAALSFPVAGTVARTFADEGRRVGKGHLLAELDPTSARRTFEAAEAALNQAKDACARLKQLYDAESLPEIKWVEAQTRLRQAEAAFGIAKKNLEDCSLYAPFSGVVGQRRISAGETALPGVPVLALTASATKLVAEDIMRHLRFAEPHILRSSFARPNLSYSVRRTDDKNGQLLRLVRNVPGTGIVYVRTREGTEQIADLLRQEGTTAAAYHGGLGHAERSLRQEEWLSGKTRVMVATNAFGMGIDKADVRFVVHYAMCDSLESYYQEAGRAGRDSQRAYALLLVASDDSDRIARRFEQEFPPLEKIKEIYERICSYLQIGIGDGGEASFLFNIHDFCARERLYSGTVTSALKLLQQNGYMTLTDAQENPARVMFCVSRDELYKLRVQRDELDHFIRTLLRLYNGVFTEFRPIDEGELATWSGYTVQRVKELLKRLWQLRVIRYIPSNRSPILFMNEERLPRADLYIAPETYKRRQELMRERFEQMIAYAANEQECRSAVLERYFGEENPAPCGVCDICLARKRAAKAAAREAGTAPGTAHPGAAGDAPGSESALREKLLACLARSPADPHRLAAELACPPERLAEAVRELLGEGAVRTFADGRIALFSGPDGPDKAK